MLDLEGTLDHLTSGVPAHLTIDNHPIQSHVCLTLLGFEEAASCRASLDVHDEILKLPDMALPSPDIESC